MKANKVRSFVFTWGFAFTLILQGCSVPYILKLGVGQAKILWNRIPVEEYISSPDITEEQRNKLILVREAMQYSEKVLGLETNGNYSSVTQVKGGAAAHILIVAHAEKLEPYTWWFPIVGTVEYKGFFDFEDARKEEEKFRSEGYDTYLREAAAYSTLGWFDDPIFISLLEYHESVLANIIIHELTHGTIYLKGHTSFNESLAMFVGNVGALEFLKERYGEGSPHYRYANDTQHDEELFRNFLEQLSQELIDLYERDLPKEETLKKKTALFARHQKRYLELRTRFHTAAYGFFAEIPLNNAVVLSFRQYNLDHGLFYQILGLFNNDLPACIAFLKSMNETKEDPWQYLRQRLSE